MLFNLITITLLILLTIILIMLYFISSDSRRNKNNINICESNILSLKEKITSLENTINEMSSQSQPNLENILNQFQNSNKFMNSDDLMFPLEEVDNDDEDPEDEDDEDEDGEDEDDEDEGAEDDDDATAALGTADHHSSSSSGVEAAFVTMRFPQRLFKV